MQTINSYLELQESLKKFQTLNSNEKFSFHFKGQNKIYILELLKISKIYNYKIFDNVWELITKGKIKNWYSSKKEMYEDISKELKDLWFKDNKKEIQIQKEENYNDFNVEIPKVEFNEEDLTYFKGTNNDFYSHFEEKWAKSEVYENKNIEELEKMLEVLWEFTNKKQNSKYNWRMNVVKRYAEMQIKLKKEEQYLNNLTSGKEKISYNKKFDNVFNKLIEKSKENKNLISVIQDLDELFKKDKKAFEKLNDLFDSIQKKIEETWFLTQIDEDDYIDLIFENSSPNSIFEYWSILSSFFKEMKSKKWEEYETKYAYKLRFDDYKYFNGNQNLIFKYEVDAINKFKGIQNEFWQAQVWILYKVKVWQYWLDTFWKDYKLLFTNDWLKNLIKKEVIERSYNFSKSYDKDEIYTFKFDRNEISTNKTKEQINNKFENWTLKEFIDYVSENLTSKEWLEIIIV